MVSAIKKIVDGDPGGVESYGLAEKAVTLTGLRDDVACIGLCHR
jgi:hypothetical protein